MALSPERHSARMSEIKNVRLELYGAENLNDDDTAWALKG